MNELIATTAMAKMARMRKRIRSIPGGTSAGKTFGIIPILIEKAIDNAGLEISIVSESIPHLRKGAMRDFLKIMRSLGQYIDDHWNRSYLTYTFSNGSYIEFFSADDETKVRGPRRNILFINECNNLSFDTYYQLAIRTSREIWLDFNPSLRFWVHDELTDDEDAEWLTLTYKDNEALDKAIVKEIEKAKVKAYYDPDENIFDKSNVKNAYWDNWWKVYGLGLLGALEGVIFTNWKIIKHVPDEAVKVGTGLDFGYTNDPTAVVDVYRWNGKRILDEVCYQTKLMNNVIAQKLDNNVMTYADSAEPKSIDEIRMHGISNILPVFKGSDSIIFGIQIMQQQEYLVTERSTNLIKELRNYCWDQDKTGKMLNKPVDAFNHAIDAVRYHEMMTLGRPVMNQWVF